MSKRTEMPSTAGQIFHGCCHCVAITFSATDPSRQILACHCDDCWCVMGRHRRPKGQLPLYQRCQPDLVSQFGLGAPGVCNQCDSNLFYQLDGEDMMSVSTGMLDNTDDLTVEDQLSASKHPKWGPLPTTTPDLDEALLGRFETG